MSQSRSQMVAGAVQEHLGFILEPAKRAGMDDPGAVPLKFSSIGVALLRVFSSAAFPGLLRERGERCPFGGLHFLAGFPAVLHLSDGRDSNLSCNARWARRASNLITIKSNSA